MREDTQVKIAGKVSVEAVIEALKTELGIEATDNTSTKTTQYDLDDTIYQGSETGVKSVAGIISFEYKGEQHDLFYYHTEFVFVSKESLEMAIKPNDMSLSSEVTYLTLGYNGNSVEIMTALAKHFDGYIDEDDCDEHGYHKVDEVNL